MASVGWWILVVVVGLIGLILARTLVRLVAGAGPGGVPGGQGHPRWTRLARRVAGGPHGDGNAG